MWAIFSYEATESDLERANERQEQPVSPQTARREEQGSMAEVKKPPLPCSSQAPAPQSQEQWHHFTMRKPNGKFMLVVKDAAIIFYLVETFEILQRMGLLTCGHHGVPQRKKAGVFRPDFNGAFQAFSSSLARLPLLARAS